MVWWSKYTKTNNQKRLQNRNAKKKGKIKITKIDEGVNFFLKTLFKRKLLYRNKKYKYIKKYFYIKLLKTHFITSICLIIKMTIKT